MRDAFTFKGGHAAALFFGFFALVIGVNALFITLAVSTFPGEDVPKSYLQGVHYNDALQKRAAEARLGWTAQAGFDGEALVVSVEDREGRPLEGLALTGVLRRPASAGEDRPLAFVAESGGRYRASTPRLAPGAWDMRIKAARGSQTLDITGRLTWTP